MSTPAVGFAATARFNESDLLETIRLRSLRPLDPGVVVGPGDDCAVIRTDSGSTLLLTVDQLVVGRHVTGSTPLNLIARKALARSVSDIAAMAGLPKWSLVAAALPTTTAAADADELSRCLHSWGIHFAVPVVGGDIASAAGPLVLSVTVVGELPDGEVPILRSGAKVGDGVYVTGSLGGTFDPATGLGTHLTFTPRVKQARSLRATLGSRLHAMMDLSDGLGTDGARIAKASGVMMRVDAARVPRSPQTRSWRSAVGDGEDYELVFTASGPVPGDVEGLRVTHVGDIVAGDGCWVLEGGETFDASRMGWSHGVAPGAE